MANMVAPKVQRRSKLAGRFLVSRSQTGVWEREWHENDEFNVGPSGLALHIIRESWFMEHSPRSLLILGTKLLAEELVDLVSEIEDYQIAGFVENLKPERCQETLAGLPIFWVDNIAHLVDSHWAICGISTTLWSQFVEQVSPIGIKFATLVYPLARVSSRSSLR